MGTLVFLLWQYTAGYSQDKISFCVIQASTARESKVQSSTDKHSSDPDKMKCTIPHPEIQSGKHRTSQLCTYKKQH